MFKYSFNIGLMTDTLRRISKSEFCSVENPRKADERHSFSGDRWTHSERRIGAAEHVLVPLVDPLELSQFRKP